MKKNSQEDKKNVNNNKSKQSTNTKTGSGLVNFVFKCGGLTYNLFEKTILATGDFLKELEGGLKKVGFDISKFTALFPIISILYEWVIETLKERESAGGGGKSSGDGKKKDGNKNDKSIKIPKTNEEKKEITIPKSIQDSLIKEGIQVTQNDDQNYKIEIPPVREITKNQKGV